MRHAIVILEDNDDRLAALKTAAADKFPYFEFRAFRTAPSLIDWLPQHLSRVILFSLDHDLEPTGDLLGANDPGTGRDISDYLARQAPQCPVVIHSTNVHAALAMESNLAESGWRVERITPYDNLTWVSEAWLPLVRQLIVASARPVARTADSAAHFSR